VLESNRDLIGFVANRNGSQSGDDSDNIKTSGMLLRFLSEVIIVPFCSSLETFSWGTVLIVRRPLGHPRDTRTFCSPHCGVVLSASSGSQSHVTRIPARWSRYNSSDAHHTNSRLLKQCLVFCLHILSHLRQHAVCMSDGDWHEKDRNSRPLSLLVPTLYHHDTC
jgi:hypothetical protein